MAKPAAAAVVLPAATVAALQRRLAAYRPVDPADSATKSAAPLQVDATPTFGPLTAAALQVFLGRDPTGDVDAATTRALQSHLGVAVTGNFDTATQAALAQALSDGTF